MEAMTQKNPADYHIEPLWYWVSPDRKLWEVETDFMDGAVEMRECTAEIVADVPQLRVQLYAYGETKWFSAEGWVELGEHDARLVAAVAQARKGG